ncbi:hypothetical protein E4U54_008629, partial [Claviceps lovelessii]
MRDVEFLYAIFLLDSAFRNTTGRGNSPDVAANLAAGLAHGSRKKKAEKAEKNL